MKNRLLCLIPWLLLSSLAWGLQNPPVIPQAKPAPPAEKTQSEAQDDFIIGLEDVLAVLVWREPELSAPKVVVRPDGKISLPLINEIEASGLTTEQLQEEITEKLKEFVASPNVTVTVVQIFSRKVSIVGEVGTPGVYPLGAPMTVLDLLARAGGLREYAKKKDIIIVRKEGDRSIRFKFNYNDVSKGKNLDQNITLRNGDVVIVP